MTHLKHNLHNLCRNKVSYSLQAQLSHSTQPITKPEEIVFNSQKTTRRTTLALARLSSTLQELLHQAMALILDLQQDPAKGKISMHKTSTP